MTRPCTPIFITMLPPTTAHSRAARANVPWYFSDIAALSPVGPIVSVEAPMRTSTRGQLTSGCAPATVCGDLADEPEKKLDIRPEDPDEESEALGAPRPPPAEQPPARSASASQAPIEARSHHRIR